MTRQDYLEHAEECERFAAMAKMPANQSAIIAMKPTIVSLASG